MTTIAYRDGILVADRKAYLGRFHTGHIQKSKARRLDDGRLFAASSAIVGACDALFNWVNNPGSEPPVIKDASLENDFAILIVNKDGSITHYHDGWLPVTFSCAFFAIGSGDAYALGAMAAGMRAEEAVKIASQLDQFTGPEVDVFYLEPKEI